MSPGYRSTDLPSYRFTKSQFACYQLATIPDYTIRYKTVDLQRATPATTGLELADDLPATEPQPEELLTAAIKPSELEQALRLLVPERAEALSLRFFGELSNREVATIMQKSEDAVKMLLHRGIQELRMRLPALLVEI